MKKILVGLFVGVFLGLILYALGDTAVTLYKDARTAASSGNYKDFVLNIVAGVLLIYLMLSSSSKHRRTVKKLKSQVIELENATEGYRYRGEEDRLRKERDKLREEGASMSAELTYQARLIKEYELLVTKDTQDKIKKFIFSEDDR
tara:strand:+ start:24182 stop:24619 length:438 start_codon:yes stop_codon:yes gene_type:complete